MFGWFKKQRHALSTVILGLDGRVAEALVPALSALQRKMTEEGEDHAVTRNAMAQAVRMLLESGDAWRSTALTGEAFDRESDAADAGLHLFSEFSARYAHLPAVDAPRRVVVALSVGYAGEVPDLEKPVHSAEDARAALTALLSLCQSGGAALLHLHVVPLPDDEDAVTAAFPELLDL
jgi:hypothetical protein